MTIRANLIQLETIWGKLRKFGPVGDIRQWRSRHIAGVACFQIIYGDSGEFTAVREIWIRDIAGVAFSRQFNGIRGNLTQFRAIWEKPGGAI